MSNEFKLSDDENEVTPSICEVADCLKEAGSYDASLSNQEMYELYQVLNRSKSTATAEDQQRRIWKDTDKNCKMIDELRKHSVPVDVENSDLVSASPTSTVKENKFLKKEVKQKLDDFDDVDVFNSVPTNHKPLPQIAYTPKYNPPIYCNPKIVNLSLSEKKRIIFEYHKKLIQIYDSYQRQSPHYAPYGKPILPDVRFNGTLLRNKNNSLSYDFEEDNEIFEQDNNSNDIYVMRTGRQTKRKLYAENKDDEKKFKSSQNSPSSSQTKKRSMNDSMKNEEIMKKSKLFTNKAEKLYDKLIEKKEKDEEEEKENTKFMNSLQCNSDDDYIDDPGDIAKIVHSEEPVIRRRIPPPLRGKKAARGRGKFREAVVKNNVVRKTSPIYESLDISTSPKSKGKNVGICPMCNFEFPQDKLESHADQCIDIFEHKEDVTLPTAGSKIVCEHCDLVLPLTMDYEIHVRECLSKSQL